MSVENYNNRVIYETTEYLLHEIKPLLPPPVNRKVNLSLARFLSVPISLRVPHIRHDLINLIDRYLFGNN